MIHKLTSYLGGALPRAALVLVLGLGNISVADATGSVTLNWLPPQENVDGSALTDLTGYRFFAWSERNNGLVVVTVHSGVTSYTFNGLKPGVWAFVGVSMSAGGQVSDMSNVVWKTIP